MKKLNPESLARLSSRYPWQTIAFWLVLIATMGIISSKLLSGVLTQDVTITNNPESQRVEKILDEKFRTGNEPRTTEFVIIKSDRLSVNDQLFESKVRSITSEISKLDGEALANAPINYYDAKQAAPEQAVGLVAKNGQATLITVGLKELDDEFIDKLRAFAKSETADGFTVQVAGNGSLNADFTKIAEEDLRKGESVGIAIALIVLIIVFAAVFAAIVPIVMAVCAIAVATGLVALIGQLFDFNLFVTNMVSMIGLAVGIDYSLFIVSRYREERKKGFDKLEAIGASGATANRAVFFSGLTVVLALLGMLIIPVTIFRSLAGGAILVTLCAIAASMTLLPALLAILGDRINWPRLSKRAQLDNKYDPKGGLWDKLSKNVMAKPLFFLIASVLVLGSLSLYYFDLKRGTSQSVEQLSDDFESKQAFITLENEFAGGLGDPAKVIVTGEVNSQQTQDNIKEFEQQLGNDEVFVPQVNVIPSRDNTALELDVYFKGDPSGNAAFEAIRDLRQNIIPAVFAGGNTEVLVGGNTASFTDFLDIADRYQSVVVAFVLALSFLLLTVVFRSVVLPFTAILMNLLSVGAAYGAVTLVFQKGVAIDFFNSLGFQFQQTPAIEAWLPLFLFSVLFGLSMDYHVFLLTRIREEYDKTKDNTEAIAYGLRTTASIITGAALIMVAVFTGFAAGRLGPLQQMGFGLAVAVLMDATIVRTLLVPASMRLLGKRNWYLPSWLEWLPQINVEGHEPKLKKRPAKNKPAAKHLKK